MRKAKLKLTHSEMIIISDIVSQFADRPIPKYYILGNIVSAAASEMIPIVAKRTIEVYKKTRMLSLSFTHAIALSVIIRTNTFINDDSLFVASLANIQLQLEPQLP